MTVLSTDQKMVLEMVRKVSLEVLWEKAPEYEQSGQYPWSQLKQLAGLGLLGMTTPEAWGGAGLDSVTWALAMEEIAAADPSVAVILSVTSGLPQYMLNKYGSDAQKKKYLLPLARGDWIGAFCLTEPHAGSDPASMKLSAKKAPGGWRLDGLKSWVTSGGQAQVYVVMAKGEGGISTFIVEKNTPGLSFGKPEDKMGLHAAHTSEVRFDGVFVSDQNLLGQEGRGLAQALAGLDSGRIGIAAQAVGMARAAFEIARRYADERTQFGQKIREFQGVGFKLAEMHTRIAAARALVLEAAAQKDRGEKYTLEASTAKLFASDVAVGVTREAVQVLGGYGYHREYRVERYYRDAKITEIYEGTSEIQKLVIARELYR
jgi:alkylation response protein AidB-like acyl-CoA dehydrogenase